MKKNSSKHFVIESISNGVSLIYLNDKWSHNVTMWHHWRGGQKSRLSIFQVDEKLMATNNSSCCVGTLITNIYNFDTRVHPPAPSQTGAYGEDYTREHTCIRCQAAQQNRNVCTEPLPQLITTDVRVSGSLQRDYVRNSSTSALTVPSSQRQRRTPRLSRCLLTSRTRREGKMMR